MTTEIKLGQAIMAAETISELIKTEVSPTLGWKLAKIGKYLEEEAHFFFAVRDKLLKKYGDEVKDKDGKGTGRYGSPEANTPNWVEYITALNPLSDESIPFPFKKIALSEFGNAKLSTMQILRMEFMIDGLDPATMQDDDADAVIAARAEARKKKMETQTEDV
jgi:hypothetical protein